MNPGDRVKCINPDMFGMLTYGQFYTVEKELKGSHVMLEGVAGLFKGDRFAVPEQLPEVEWQEFAALDAFSVAQVQAILESAKNRSFDSVEHALNWVADAFKPQPQVSGLNP